MIPEGTYKAKAVSAVLGTARTGTKQVGVDLVLLEGPALGEHLTWYGYFTDASWERTVDSLVLLGWNSDDLSDLSGIGRTEVNVVVTHEPDLQGEIRARAAWINDLGGVAMQNRMSPDEARSFASEMKGRILSLKRGERPTRAPAPGAAPSGGQRPTQTELDSKVRDDSDIPF